MLSKNVKNKYKEFACFIMGFKPTTLSHADIDNNGICAVIRSKVYVLKCMLRLNLSSPFLRDKFVDISVFFRACSPCANYCSCHIISADSTAVYCIE